MPKGVEHLSSRLHPLGEGIAADTIRDPDGIQGDFGEASMRWALASILCAVGGAGLYGLPAMKAVEGELVQVGASTVGCRRLDLHRRRLRYAREDRAAAANFIAGAMMGRECAWLSAGEFVHLDERTGSDMRIRHRGVSYWVPSSSLRAP
jgi:hypothetical protein